MQLPDIYFMFDWRRGERPLYFHRDRGGTIRRVEASNVIPPEGSLLIHGPGTPVWDEPGLALLARVRDGAGAMLPLGAVLSRCGFPSRIPRGELLERLGGARVELDDPRRAGLEILTRLAEILEDLETTPSASPDPSPGPRARLVADISYAPEGPGVYRFVTSDGEPIYVGKAKSLRRRLASHVRAKGGEPDKRAALVAGATGVHWEETGSELEALLREHLTLRREPPAINVQRRAHQRPRGQWRNRALAMLLPSSEKGHNEVILVAGDGRFHCERVLQAPELPGGFWKRVSAFLEGRNPGRGPGEVRLTEDEQTELAEIALTWIVRHETQVNQIDLTNETPSPELKRRFASWLSLDPAGERTEVR